MRGSIFNEVLSAPYIYAVYAQLVFNLLMSKRGLAIKITAPPDMVNS